jgi:hypothetical protein
MNTSLSRALALCALLAAACSRTPAEPTVSTATDLAQHVPGVPTTSPSLVGVVVEMQPDSRVLLEHRPIRPECQRRALATIGPNTVVVRRNGRVAASSDIRAGQEVTAWFGETELRSCPVQVAAVAIIIP